MAFDFGRRRIGLASADSLTRSARPLGALQYTKEIDWTGIEQWIRDLRPCQLVVGIPTHADGSPGALTRAAQSFARELERRFKLPVATVDERWSSLEASGRLKAARRDGLRKPRVRHEDVDAAAAGVILERWLNST